MKLAQLLALANKKAIEAQAILEGENPTTEDIEKANGLIAESEGYKSRADTMRKAMTLVDETKAVKTEKSGLKVTADGTDKKAAVKTWGLGEFCAAIANESTDVRPYASQGMAGFYDVGKALGPKAITTITGAKAISGMSESVPADGGFLVGTDNNYNIMGRVYSEGEIVQRVTMTPLSGNSNGMTFLRSAESARADGSRWGGAQYYWACEAAEKTKSKPTFERVSMELNKILGLVYATDELLQDATALEAYIMDILPRELRFGVQEAFYNGPGGGIPMGILNAPCLVTQAAEPAQAAATIVSENVINMWSRRWVGATDYVWMINQDVTPQLIQMNLGVGTGGALTYMPPGGLSGLQYGSLFGRPVIEIEHCFTLGTVGDIALCAWNEYQAIEKGPMQSASSIHVRFIFDETVFRFVYRVDGQPKWSLPLTPYRSAITQGPFVVLETRA